MESWKIGIFLILGMLVYQYFDIPLPDDMDEKWKVRIIDATMRTYGHTVAALSALNMMKPFSHLDKAAADFCLNLITTGWPWRIWHDPALKIKDIYTDMNQVHLRVYEPIATLEQQNRPVFVYFHGGGFSLLSIDSYDVMTRKIARDSGITVVSVKLSPQYSYPIPQDDCVEAVEYLIDNASLLRIDPKRIAIGGDSAGGNLAASISLRMRSKIKLQLLLVPVLHLFNFNTTSIIENKMYFSSTTNNLHQVAFWMNYINESYTHIPEMLENKHTSAEMKTSKFGSFVDQEKWMIRKHIRSEVLKTGSLEQKKNFGRNDMPTSFIEKLKNPYIAPLMADEDMLIGLPSAYVMTAGYDIIRDDGIMYAERLKNANVNVHMNNYESAFHNTLQFSDGPLKLRLAEQIIQDIVIFLKANL